MSCFKKIISRCTSSQLEHRVWNYNTKIVIFNHFAL